MYRRLNIYIGQTLLSMCLLCCSLTCVLGQKAIETDSLINAISKESQDTEKVNMLLALSAAYKQDVVTKEFIYANEALNFSQKAGWEKGKMYAEQLLGDCYIRVTAYNDAVAHFKLCVATARKLGRTDIEGKCLKLIVQSYYDMNEMEEMVFYQKELLALAERVGEPVSISSQMNSYALRLSDAGYYGEALDYWRKTISFTKEHVTRPQQDELIANILNTLSNTYVKIHKPDSALYYLRIAALLIAPTDNVRAKSYIRSTFCDVYESTRQYDSAEIYGERTVRTGEVFKNLDLQQHYCQTLSHVYDHDHKPELALAYYKRFDSLINLINNSGKTIELAMQVAKISMDQQTERNLREKTAMEAAKRSQQALLLAALIAILGFIASTILIYRNLRQKQQANKTIGLQAASLLQHNELIDKALKEKEVLLKETHHRVKNNLQLISSLLELQAANLNDEGAKEALHTAQRRVLSIATVHSKLYSNNDDEAIEFSAFVSDLFTRLTGAFGREGRDIQFDNEMPATLLPLNTVVLLGLILNELITNSFKYAFTNAEQALIRVSFKDTGAMYLLGYYDSGPGLPGGAFSESTGSLGLYLVRRLSKQLKGTVEYKYDAGCTFTIIFPNAGS